jgi:hypothetical protein
LIQDFPAARLRPYEQALEQARAHAGEHVVSAATERACRRMAGEVRKSGATPIFLVMPVISQMKLKFRPESAVASVLTFNDAAAYPQFYRTDVRAEEIHLNPKGAEAFTTFLVEDMSRRIDQNQLAER